MMEGSDLPGLYRSHPIYLWVEDQATKTYLQTVWEDSRIGFLIAAGHENIYSAVKAARQQDLAHVFGIRDRDFGRSNRQSWRKPETEVMICESFELENLALDSEAIAQCEVNTSGKDAKAIDELLQDFAKKLPWWMSYRSVLSELHAILTEHFPTHLKPDKIASETAAQEAICNSPFWTQSTPRFADTLTVSWVQTRLTDKHAEYQGMLDSQDWRARFSGKEILVDLTNRIWTKGRPPKNADLDFIRAIAKKQRELESVPGEIKDLRTALLSHI